MAVASSSQSFSSLFEWTHEVFLSFRGEDTRKTFTDHLHAALVREGIDTFIDNQLQRGEEITAELVRAIERSRIAIIVFSKNYASSRWCLDELVKIMECRQVLGQKVIPVFLEDADPRDVRHQRGSFGEPFGRHEERFGRDKVDGWRKALTQAADLAGCCLKDTNGYEAKLVQFVVKEVLIELSNTQVENRLVTIENRVQDILRFLQEDYAKGFATRFVLIYGGVGIGKTTIARAVWDQIGMTTMFECRCFLEDIHQSLQNPSGMVRLQEQLLSDILGRELHNEFSDEHGGARMIKKVLHQKKLLLVLDNVVDCDSSLNGLALAECLFGTGSRIIVTTGNKLHFEHWYKENRVFWNGFLYKPNELNLNESLKLLCINAFGSNHPPRDFKKLAEKMVIATGGLPLALDQLGFSLYKKTPTQFERKAQQRIDEAVQNNL